MRRPPNFASASAPMASLFQSGSLGGASLSVYVRRLARMNTKPKSAYEKTNGMTWFPRMLDKIRLHAGGGLHPDFHASLGLPLGMDGFCCRYLRVAYSDLKNRVLEGGADEQILQWCFERGRTLDETDLIVWNEFVRKFGW